MYLFVLILSISCMVDSFPTNSELQKQDTDIKPNSIIESKVDKTVKHQRQNGIIAVISNVTAKFGTNVFKTKKNGNVRTSVVITPTTKIQNANNKSNGSTIEIPEQEFKINETYDSSIGLHNNTDNSVDNSVISTQEPSSKSFQQTINPEMTMTTETINEIEETFPMITKKTVTTNILSTTSQELTNSLRIQKAEGPAIINNELKSTILVPSTIKETKTIPTTKHIKTNPFPDIIDIGKSTLTTPTVPFTTEVESDINSKATISSVIHISNSIVQSNSNKTERTVAKIKSSFTSYSSTINIGDITKTYSTSTFTSQVVSHSKNVVYSSSPPTSLKVNSENITDAVIDLMTYIPLCPKQPLIESSTTKTSQGTTSSTTTTSQGTTSSTTTTSQGTTKLPKSFPNTVTSKDTYPTLITITTIAAVLSNKTFSSTDSFSTSTKSLTIVNSIPLPTKSTSIVMPHTDRLISVNDTKENTSPPFHDYSTPTKSSHKMLITANMISVNDTKENISPSFHDQITPTKSSHKMSISPSFYDHITPTKSSHKLLNTIDSIRILKQFGNTENHMTSVSTNHHSIIGSNNRTSTNLRINATSIDIFPSLTVKHNRKKIAKENKVTKSLKAGDTTSMLDTVDTKWLSLSVLQNIPITNAVTTSTTYKDNSYMVKSTLSVSTRLKSTVYERAEDSQLNKINKTFIPKSSPETPSTTHVTLPQVNDTKSAISKSAIPVILPTPLLVVSSRIFTESSKKQLFKSTPYLTRLDSKSTIVAIVTSMPLSIEVQETVSAILPTHSPAISSRILTEYTKKEHFKSTPHLSILDSKSTTVAIEAGIPISIVEQNITATLLRKQTLSTVSSSCSCEKDEEGKLFKFDLKAVELLNNSEQQLAFTSYLQSFISTNYPTIKLDIFNDDAVNNHKSMQSLLTEKRYNNQYEIESESYFQSNTQKLYTYRSIYKCDRAVRFCSVDRRFCEYHEGDEATKLTIIVPYGGVLKPEKMVPSGKKYKTPSEITKAIALRVSNILKQTTGYRPHVIIMNIHPQYIDVENFYQGGFNSEDMIAKQTWQDFHKFISQAKKMVSGNGLIIVLDNNLDTKISSMIEKTKEIKLFYSISDKDAEKGDFSKSSMKSLANRVDNSVETFRGKKSFEQYLRSHGISASTKSSNSHEMDLVKAYGSYYGGNIDAVKVVLSDDITNSNEQFLQNISDAITEFLNLYYRSWIS